MNYVVNLALPIVNALHDVRFDVLWCPVPMQ
jgi:hypothetical protein